MRTTAVASQQIFAYTQSPYLVGICQTYCMIPTVQQTLQQVDWHACILIPEGMILKSGGKICSGVENQQTLVHCHALYQNC